MFADHGSRCRDVFQIKVSFYIYSSEKIKNIFVQKGRNWRNWRNLGLKPLLYKDFIVTLLVTLLDLEV